MKNVQKSAIKAGLAGAAIGVTVAGAAVLLSDEKNRKKVVAKMKSVRKLAGKTVSGVSQKYDEVKKEGFSSIGVKGGSQDKGRNTE